MPTAVGIFEYMFAFSKTGRKYQIQWGKIGAGISTKDKIAYEHPAIFPEQLARDQIKTWSNEGDLVYDPFIGSGTTAKVASILERNWVGSEISTDYTNIANKRLQNHLKEKLF